jgi:general secretion pathway protein K
MATGQLRRRLRWESRGYALIIVLWAFVLISLIVIHLTASGRIELRVAGNIAANSAAQAAADGAVYQTIFNLLNPQRDEQWRLDGSTHELQVANSRVAVRLGDEAARINPNTASLALIQSLLGALASNTEQAAAVASAIAEWIGSRKGSQPLTETSGDDRAPGLAYRPPGEPLESIDELGRVRGMTPDLLEALRPHLTLFGPAVPNAETADPVVAGALADAAKTSPAVALPLAPVSNSEVLTARIIATARGPGNAVATRLAIARVGPGVPHGYAMLAWANNIE